MSSERYVHRRGCYGNAKNSPLDLDSDQGEPLVVCRIVAPYSAAEELLFLRIFLRGDRKVTV